MATGHGRGGSNGRGKAKSAAEAQRLAPPPVALRATSPPHPRRGVFLQSSSFATETRLVRIVQERLP